MAIVRLRDDNDEIWEFPALIGPMGPRGIQGEKGDLGEKGDKGDKGDAFTFEDFTSEQLEAIRGPQGKPGRDSISPDGILWSFAIADDIQDMFAGDINTSELPTPSPNIQDPYGHEFEGDAYGHTLVDNQ